MVRYSHNPEALPVLDSERRVYAFCVQFDKQHRRMPSRREIADHIGWKRESAATDVLIRLKARGVMSCHGSMGRPEFVITGGL